jgi:hypothetical protein
VHAGDAWRVTRTLTLNLGFRVDRYRIFLPEQQHPASGPGAQRFAAVPDLGSWTVAAPRIGAAWDPTGSGRTILKGTYGRYWFPPGAVGPNSNPNSSVWWVRYRWSDANADGIWQPGEEDASQPLASRGGATLESIDPNLELSYASEATGWIERQIGRHLGVRSGIVWRGERQPMIRQNAAWPYEAFSSPISITDPGPDGQLDSADDGLPIQGYQLDRSFVGLTPEHVVKNVAGAGSAHLTWEAASHRRLNGRWSLAAAFACTWNRDHAARYFGQPVRANALPLTPNDRINADDRGRYRFTTWTLKAHGTYEGPWGVRIAPLLRYQSGQPFGRTFTRRLNYGDVRILAEPIGTRRMAGVLLVDLRGQKRVSLPGGRHAALFVDVFNLFNVNPEETMNWSSGSAFLRPLVIVAPRVARLGVQMAW